MSHAPSPAELRGAALWLKMHGLPVGQPAALIATRLAARQRARLAGSLLLGAFLLAVALTYAAYLGSSAPRYTPLLIITAVVIALVAGQSMVDRWVRRVDQRVAAGLQRRVAHPGRLGWRTVVGLPRALFAAGTFAGMVALAFGALAVGDSVGRYAAVILLFGACGVAVVAGLQLNHLLTHPAVADDETSLTADVIMRIEDAREATLPTVLWCLPTVSLLDTVPGWWTAAWIAFTLLGVGALVLITLRTAPSGVVGRHVMSAR
jgi:hypothetical protein